MAVLETARFRLSEGVAVEDFLAQNTRVELEFAIAQPGYRPGSRRTTITDDGTWVISLGWGSKADADAGLASFIDSPATKGLLDLIDLGSMSTERMTEIPAPSSRKTANARALYLEGIRDGRAREAVTAYTGDRYTQHSTGVRDGVEGFVEFFDQFVERNPERHVEIVRAIEDGPYVFLHAYQSLGGGESQWVTTDLFDTDGNDRIVEHWDVISAFAGPNPAGRTQVDGTTAITDLDRTEDNKTRVREMIQRVLIDGDGAAAADYISAETYLQHNPQGDDGLEALGAMLKQLAARGTSMSYRNVFKIIGQGNFVAAYSLMDLGGDELAVFDLFRLESGMIVEHWDNMEPLPPADELVNGGKF